MTIVWGCAHTPDPGFRTDPSPPANSLAGNFAAPDGTKLFTRNWQARTASRGIVVIVHGLKDHSARYAQFATRLADAGYDVWAFDLRGHGRSAGPRVSPDDWEDYVDDLRAFVKQLANPTPLPIFVFGHSMGGAIVTLAAIRDPKQFAAGVILSGPALAIDASPLLVAATRMSGFLTPKFPAFKLPNDKFSSDPAAEKQMDNDPLISQPPAPAKTAAGLVAGMHEIWDHVDNLTMPILALHGTRDRLTAPSGSRALIREAPSSDRTLKIYPNFAHDLLHEPTGKQVEDDIVAWLDAHTGGKPLEPTPIYAGHLAGDPRGWTQGVEATGGIVWKDDRKNFTGSFAFQLARPRPLGWHGELTARYASNYRSVALRPLGAALRAGPAMLGVAFGASFVTGKEFAASGGAMIEVPLGPIHAGAQLEFSRIFGGNPTGTFNAELVWTTLSLRFPGDKAYWPHAHAGVGPVLQGGSAWLQDAQAWILTIGLELYGAD